MVSERIFYFLKETEIFIIAGTMIFGIALGSIKPVSTKIAIVLITVGIILQIIGIYIKEKDKKEIISP